MYKGIYESFCKNVSKKSAEPKSFLTHIIIWKFSEDKVKLCEEYLTKKDLYDSLKSMQN